MYAVYCNNYDKAEQLLHKLLKRRKDFETAVNVSSPTIIVICDELVFVYRDALVIHVL